MRARRTVKKTTAKKTAKKAKKKVAKKIKKPVTRFTPPPNPDHVGVDSVWAGNKNYFYVQPPRTRFLMSDDGRIVKADVPWTLFRVVTGPRGGFQNLFVYFSDKKIDLKNKKQTLRVSNFCWDNIGDNGYVCLGDTKSKVARGKASPFDAFWLSTFDMYRNIKEVTRKHFLSQQGPQLGPLLENGIEKYPWNNFW